MDSGHKYCGLSVQQLPLAQSVLSYTASDVRIYYVSVKAYYKLYALAEFCFKVQIHRISARH